LHNNELGYGRLNVEKSLTATPYQDLCLYGPQDINHLGPLIWASRSIMLPCNYQPYIFEPGSTGLFIAGDFIKILPGFSAKSGSDVGFQIGSLVNPLSGGMRRFSFSNLNRWAQTDGSGQLTTDKTQDKQKIAPRDNSLQQNYPNPFNPSTAIKYSVLKDGNVTLTIYNLLGQVLETLSNGFQKAGVYEAYFNGENYASGVYIYKLTTNGFTTSKKMLLIK